MRLPLFLLAPALLALAPSPASAAINMPSLPHRCGSTSLALQVSYSGRSTCRSSRQLDARDIVRFYYQQNAGRRTTKVTTRYLTYRCVKSLRSTYVRLDCTTSATRVAAKLRAPLKVRWAEDVDL